MKRETPMQWETVLEGAGLHSARDLARELGVSPSTASRLLHGEQTSRDTIEAAATLLGISPERVRELRDEVALPPFRLPPDADRLSQRQRAAIVAVVRAMLEPTDATSIAERTVEQADEEDTATLTSLAALSQDRDNVPKSPRPPRHRP